MVGRFSPLLSYPQVRFGASRPLAESAARLSALLGFPVSAAAVPRTTGESGERLDEGPYRLREARLQASRCERLRGAARRGMD